MKKITTLLMAGAVLAACQSTPQQTVLKGHIQGVESDTLLINYVSIANTDRAAVQRDTIAMQNGEFTYVLPADTAVTRVHLYAKPVANGAYDMTANTRLLVFPGQTAVLNGELKTCKVSGSDFHQQLEAYEALRQPIFQQMDSVSKELSNLSRTKIAREEIKQLYQKAYQPLNQQLIDLRMKYIQEHLDSDVALYLLSQVKPKEAKEWMLQLAPAVQQGPLAPIYQQMLREQERQEAFEKAAKNIVPGKEAPDFTLNDIKGKPLKLSSLRGKYVVLDFWGSWCGWCIKGMPEMKKYYAKYKQKLEILGIDCGDPEKTWKESVAKNELPWLHVRNETPEDVTRLFAVGGYPTKIIVNPQGLIDKVVVGEDPAFYQYLDQLFKK